MRTTITNTLYAAFVLVVYGLCALAGAGWLVNLIAFVKAPGLLGMPLLRLAGVLFAPLGAVLGFI